MAHPSPLIPLHMVGEGMLAPYGPADRAVQLVEAFDPVEVEYAAIRRHAAVFDAPHRGTLVFTGPDRVSFLNRMLTPELKDLAPLESRRALLLNRKGRIDADLRLVALTDRVVADVDVFAAARAKAELDKYVITEDVTIADATTEYAVLSVHGPAAAAVVGRGIEEIGPGRAAVVTIAGAEVIVDRWDWAGEIGLDLRVPVARVGEVYEAISTPWSARERPGAITPQTERARRIGWHALNMARIEAGTPLYMLDFGPDSLPHECGDAVLNDRVSFKKGCYLGQEIVARMQSLGHPKQKLVGLRVEVREGAQAATGTPIVDADVPGAAVVGAVTSSCLSPMLGQAPIAIAMVKWSHASAGKQLWAQLDGARVGMVVQESMRFVRR